MMKNIKLFFLLSLCFLPKGYAITDDTKPCNYLTFYFVDNSDGNNSNSLDNELVDQLKENLKNLINRSENCFYFYGCNGKEPVFSDNLLSFLGGSKLNKYLKNPSKESEY